jgi:hypothetical protein
MGIFGNYECPDTGCDYESTCLLIGPGMISDRELRSCAACGGLTTVLTVRPGPDGPKPASGRGRCPECGSQRLRRPTIAAAGDTDAGDADHDGEPPCPRCETPLVFRSAGMWD